MLTILADQCITQMRTSHDTSQHTRRDKAPSYSQPVRKYSPSCRSASLRHGEKSSEMPALRPDARSARNQEGYAAGSCEGSREEATSEAVGVDLVCIGSARYLFAYVGVRTTASC